MQTSIFDVAAYIRSRSGPGLTAKKLQKLCFYSKAWSLAQTGDPLFPEQFQAWADGPVSRELFSTHRGCWYMPHGWSPGDPSHITDAQRKMLDAVMEAYQSMSGDQMGEMTHREAPWLDARGETPPGASSDGLIQDGAIKRFYTKQALRGQAPPQVAATSTRQAPQRSVAESVERQLSRWAGVNQRLAPR